MKHQFTELTITLEELLLPKGNHKIHFEYLPESFVITKYVSLVLSSLVVLGLLVSVGLNFGKKKVETE